jgi:predicted amino acid dehydrogenase
LQSDLKAGGAAAQLSLHTEMAALRNAQLILTVTSSLKAVVEPEHLQTGSVICDVARPRDVSARVSAHRNDVLVIDGGMVKVPGPVDFHFDFGLPSGKAYACMAETMALALEGRYENFSLGKQITRAKVEEIAEIAGRHGFELTGFRSFERPIPPEQIERVRACAHHLRKGSRSASPGQITPTLGPSRSVPMSQGGHYG